MQTLPTMFLSVKAPDGGNAFLSPRHFPGGAPRGQTCWELTVCSELAFIALQECVCTVLSYLFLKRHHQSSVCTRQSQARLLRLASRCLSTRGRSFWCGWETQIRGQHGCCVPKRVPRAFETLKKYICFVQNASLSSSFCKYNSKTNENHGDEIPKMRNQSIKKSTTKLMLIPSGSGESREDGNL